MSNLTLREAALYYASLGWPVFPCVPNEKRPLTNNGHKAATTDQATIESWWASSPTANIGLALDAAGLVAFDPDLYKPDCEWETFISHRQLPETLTQATASGGKHFIFQADEGFKYPGQLCKHVDIKHSGYIILAPSVFNGRAYVWETNKAPATAPRWFETPKLPTLPAPLKKPSASEIADLLQYVNADVGYDEWFKILMAVHDGTGGSDEGFALVDQWSTKGTKYKGTADVHGHWKSFNGGGVTIGTLADAARAGGADLAAISHRYKYDAAKIDWGHTPAPTLPLPPVPVQATLNIQSGDKFEGQEIKPRLWLVPNLIPLNDVTLFSGNGGVGKSLLTLQLAASVAVTGMGIWLNQIAHGDSALYVTAEDTNDEIHRRLDDIRRAAGKSYADYSNLHLLSLAGEDGIMAAPLHKGGALMVSPIFTALQDAIIRLKPSLLVLDNSSDMFGGDENAKSEARQFVQILRGLCIHHNVTIVLLIHPSKNGMDTDQTAGSVAWRNSARGMLALTQPADAPDNRVLESLKNNYGPSSSTVSIRYDDGVFVPVNPLDVNENNGSDDTLFMKLLAQFHTEGRNVSAYKSPTYAPTTFVSHPMNSGVSKSRLEKAMNRLLAAERIQNIEQGPPSKRRNFLCITQVPL